MGLFLDFVINPLSAAAIVSFDHFLSLFIERIQHIFFGAFVHSEGPWPDLFRLEPPAEPAHEQLLLAQGLERVLLHQVGRVRLYLILSLFSHLFGVHVLDVQVRILFGFVIKLLLQALARGLTGIQLVFESGQICLVVHLPLVQDVIIDLDVATSLNLLHMGRFAIVDLFALHLVDSLLTNGELVTSRISAETHQSLEPGGE